VKAIKLISKVGREF